VKSYLVNERILAHRVKVILSNGENKGEMLKVAAIDLARRDGLDLVEVSSGAIPICKIMDFGKLKYEQSKAERHQKHAPSVKEIKVNYNTGDHDLEIKRKKCVELLEGGHKVVFVMQLKGREKFVTGNAAKEKFKSIVSEYFNLFKVSDIQDGGNNFRVVVTPKG
jgi:translation initiation factor IF-3